jgi:ribosome-binding factor A
MRRRRESNARSGRERSQRQLRVGEVIRHALVTVLARGDLRDPDLDGVSITVSEVRVSPDLRNVTAFVMPLGGNDAQKIVDALKRAAPYLRRRIGKNSNMKYLPALNFVIDDAFDQGTRIDTLLRSTDIVRDLDDAPDDDNATDHDE